MNTSAAAGDLSWLNLSRLPMTVKALFTGYLMAAGLGLFMAGAQILLTHGMADGKPGLSVNDIIYSYYGNRSGSKLEAMLNGQMKPMAPAPVRTDIIKWVREGAPEKDWAPHYQAVFAQYCIKCHSVLPNIPNFKDYGTVAKLAKVDEGASFKDLTRLSHIHLFGIAFIFFFTGLIFSFASGVPRWLKSVVVFFPFFFLVTDIASWWLTKFYWQFAYLTLIGGVGYSLASSFMWIVSLWQMWIWPLMGKRADGFAWAGDRPADSH